MQNREVETPEIPQIDLNRNVQLDLTATRMNVQLTVNKVSVISQKIQEVQEVSESTQKIIEKIPKTDNTLTSKRIVIDQKQFLPSKERQGQTHQPAQIIDMQLNGNAIKPKYSNSLEDN